jgi:hypothetical protein
MLPSVLIMPKHAASCQNSTVCNIKSGLTSWSGERVNSVNFQYTTGGTNSLNQQILKEVQS